MGLAGSNVLVVGSTGVVGSVLADALAGKGVHTFRSSRASATDSAGTLFIDLSEDMSAWKPRAPIAYAVICAGVTKIGDCAADPEGSYRVNVTGLCDLAENLVSRGAFVIFISSNQVFDGKKAYPKPDDPVSPITEYGRQKAEAEKRLSKISADIGVLRVTKALGPRNKLFDGWKESLKAGKVINPHSHMSIAPVPVGSLVYAAIQMLDFRMSGTFHLSGNRDITYYEAAIIAQEMFGADKSQVVRANESELANASETQPSRTALNMDKLAQALNWRPQEVERTITRAFSDPGALLNVE